MKKIAYGPQKNFSIFEDTMVEMTWQEVQAAADRKAVVLLPIGMVEAHGPHMDLSPDFYISGLYCRFLKQESEALDLEAIIAPNVYWGISDNVARYAGTFSLSQDTFRGLLSDILKSLQSWGFEKVFIFNAHGAPTHVNIIQEAAKAQSNGADFQVYCLWELDFEVDCDLAYPNMREDGFQPDIHAGAVETSQMYAFFPEKVRREAALALPPNNGFHPLAYWGDPASFEQEINVAEICAVDVKVDAMRIRKIVCGE